MAVKRHPIIEKIRSPFYSLRNNTFIYKNIVNRKYKLSKTEYKDIDIVQSKILDELRHYGIAVVNFNELFSNDLFEELSDWIQNNEINLKQVDKKKFLMSYYGTSNSDKPLDLKNPFFKLYLSRNLLQIVCCYLGYIPKLHEVYIEKTIPVGESLPTFSQNWHRDPEEKKTLKVFLYLNDVTIESGPFTYILKSQPTAKSIYSKMFAQKLPHGSYPDSRSIELLTSSADHYVATAPKATLIFCDTAGLHKGGYATKNERIMSTGFYPSKQYSENTLYKLPSLTNLEISNLELDPLALKVLGSD
jgi:hypothetical protein